MPPTQACPPLLPRVGTDSCFSCFSCFCCLSIVGKQETRILRYLTSTPSLWYPIAAMPALRDRAHAPLTQPQIEHAKLKALSYYRLGYSPGYAAERIGVGRTTLYDWRNTDPAFAQAWHDAYEHGSDWAEDKLHDQVDKGNTIATIVMLKIRRRFVEKEPPDPEQLAQAMLNALRQIVAAQRATAALPAPQQAAAPAEGEAVPGSGQVLDLPQGAER